MPSSATITSFYNFTANTRARATQVNNNFDQFRGHLVPIEPFTATSSNISYDIGSDEHRWRTGYVESLDFDRWTTTASTVLRADTASSSLLIKINSSISAIFFDSGGSNHVGLSRISQIRFDQSSPSALISKNRGSAQAALAFNMNGTDVFSIDESGYYGKNYKTWGTTLAVTTPGQIARSGVVGVLAKNTLTATSIVGSTLSIVSIGRPIVIGTETYAGTTFTGFMISDTTKFAVDIYRNGTAVHRVELGIDTGVTNVRYPASSIHFIDFQAPAGTNIYDIRYNALLAAGGNITISNFYLSAWEL